ncbi:hypothetical protein [Streptomyces sp. NPDC002537]
MPSYEFVLKLIWPLSSGQGVAEADQWAFDAAVDELLARIDGFPDDKSHGGRFRAVAEDGEFHSEIACSANDLEVTC